MEGNLITMITFPRIPPQRKWSFQEVRFPLELKLHQQMLVSARMCQERIFSLMSVESPRSEIGHLPRYNMTSPVDILYNVDIQIS